MTKQQSDKTIKTAWILLSMVLAVGSIIYGFGSQYQKISTLKCEQDTLRAAVTSHEKSITTLETKVDYILKGIDEIRAEVKK